MLSVLPLLIGLAAGGLAGYGLPLLGLTSQYEVGATVPGYTAEVGAGLRWTAYLAFLIFLVPLYARSLHTFLTNDFSKMLMRRRRDFGVTYGGIQIIHMVLIAQATSQIGKLPGNILTIVVGGFGLIMILVMTFTSFPGLTNWLRGETWRKIHKLGMALLVSIYFFDFVLGYVESGKLRHALCGALLLGGIAARVLAVVKKKRAR